MTFFGMKVSSEKLNPCAFTGQFHTVTQNYQTIPPHIEGQGPEVALRGFLGRFLRGFLGSKLPTPGFFPFFTFF